MKKFIIPVLLFSLLLSMTGCCCPLIAEKKVDTVAKPADPIPQETSDVIWETETPAETEAVETYAPETEPVYETEAPTEPPVSYNTVSLSEGDAQYRINLFLSNFSEAFVYDYPCDDYTMLYFAYTHVKINGDGTTYQSDEGIYMTEDDVNTILYKYLGKTLPTNGSPNYYQGQNRYDVIRYDGNNYIFDLKTVEHYCYITVVDSMVKNYDGTYTAEYAVFSLNNPGNGISKSYYYLTYDQAMRDSSIMLLYTGTAVVKDYERPNGTQSYQLISLERN